MPCIQLHKNLSIFLVVSIIYTSGKKLLTKPLGEPEVKIRKLAKKLPIPEV